MSETQPDDVPAESDEHGRVEPDAVPDEEAGETEEREDGHLDAVDADCGCAEVWETLSEQRGE
ncbi:MAG: hypothetical protein J07HB67_00747 [halophilic archaeon J07HB67]|nr:MAG: hypothetical protein J07HB67_00747 [halophilic archaeon J07HB67]